MKFRKKPVVVDAIQYTGDNHLEIKKRFVTISLHEMTANKIGSDPPKHLQGKVTALYIKTPTGYTRVNNYDWIIRESNGEFYPCKPDIFEKTYEKVEENL
jgi:hypothetical protein